MDQIPYTFRESWSTSPNQIFKDTNMETSFQPPEKEVRVWPSYTIWETWNTNLPWVLKEMNIEAPFQVESFNPEKKSYESHPIQYLKGMTHIIWKASGTQPF